MSREDIIDELSNLQKKSDGSCRTRKLSYTMKRWEFELIVDYILSREKRIVNTRPSDDKNQEMIKELVETLRNLISFHLSPALITDSTEKLAVSLAEQAIQKVEQP